MTGGLFVHTRYYGNQTAWDYDGPNGWDWFVNQLPYVSTLSGNVAVFFNPNKPFWFSRSATDYTPTVRGVTSRGR